MITHGDLETTDDFGGYLVASDLPDLASGLSAGMLREAEAIFDDWLRENVDVIRENGGTGDTQSLFTALWDSWKKAR